MSIRERVESNVAIWLLGTLSTGFIAGIGTYKGILEIAHLTVISKSVSPSKLAQGIEKMKKQNDELRMQIENLKIDRTNKTDTTRASDDSDRLPRERGSTNLPLFLPLKLSAPNFFRSVRFTGDNCEIFYLEKAAPLGLGFVEIGRKLSSIRSMYPTLVPEGIADSLKYTFSEGPFESVVYSLSSDDHDPKVIRIEYRFKNEEAKHLVRKEASKVFEHFKYSARDRGLIVEWKNVDGFNVEIGDAYVVKRRSLSDIVEEIDRSPL